MNDISFHNAGQSRDQHQFRFYSTSITPLMQSLLSTLADIDFEYEKERESLSEASPDNMKSRVLEKLKMQHRERREPYIQQLTILQNRMMETLSS